MDLPDNRRKKRVYDVSDYCDVHLGITRDSRAGFLHADVTAIKDTVEKDKGGKNTKIFNSTDAPPPALDEYLNPIPSTDLCVECRSIDISASFQEQYKVLVCHACIKAVPEKYALLTKTEVKSDYLLTESELADGSLLPCWIRPNPRSDTYSNMLLYLRFQVEEFAKNKYGSLEALDEEFEKRETQKEDRKKKRFKKKTAELRYKTLLERVKGQRVYTKDLGGHVHSFGPTVPCPEKEGWEQQVCTDCKLVKEFEVL